MKLRKRIHRRLWFYKDTIPKLATYARSHLYKRDYNLWVITGQNNQAFRGNSKYLFLHIANRTSYKAVYLCDNHTVQEELQNAGYTCYHSQSPDAATATANAGHIVVTHGCSEVPWWYTGGAKFYYMWHGIPLKTIGKNALTGRSRVKRHFWRRSTFILPDGDLTEQVFSDAFNLTSGQIERTGYPRNEAIADDFPDQHLGDDHNARTQLETTLTEWNTVIGYFPTYREGASPLSELPFDELESTLSTQDAALIVKPHPKDTTDIPNNCPHIKTLRGTLDIYPFLNDFDIFVTDYSSLYFDFLHVDNPIIFYCYDVESYADQTGFLLNFDDVTPGPITTKPSEFITALEKTFQSDDYADERQALRNQLVKNPGNACERITGQQTRDR